MAGSVQSRCWRPNGSTTPRRRADPPPAARLLRDESRRLELGADCRRAVIEVEEADAPRIAARGHLAHVAVAGLGGAQADASREHPYSVHEPAARQEPARLAIMHHGDQ